MEPENDKIRSLLNKDTMRVPESYFKQLEIDLNKQIDSLPLQKSSSNSVVKQLTIILAVAATVTIAFIGINYLFKSNESQLGMAFAEMSDGELDAYMNNQIASISADDVYGYFTQNVHQLNTDLLFNSTYSNAEQLDASITNHLHEQVLDNDALNAVIEKPITSDDDKLLETIDDELLQEYLNDATLFENLGL
jgi:hypothetical protein